jgi:hypothetical protein
MGDGLDIFALKVEESCDDEVCVNEKHKHRA